MNQAATRRLAQLAKQTEGDYNLPVLTLLYHRVGEHSEEALQEIRMRSINKEVLHKSQQLMAPVYLKYERRL